MANVADPNAWHALSVPTRHVQKTTSQPAHESLVAADGHSTKVWETRHFRGLASQYLAELARQDARIVAISSISDPTFRAPWADISQRLFSVESGVGYALQWCASLASGGSRPFAFISWEELQNSVGHVRQEICVRRAPVTLLLEPRGELNLTTDHGSVSLAGIRHLPNTSLLSAKDGGELEHMIQWCLGQGDPAVVWLPQSVEPQVTWARGSAIVDGQAEEISAGRDVAIIAWGPMVGAAAAAAASLAQYGIEAALINARFAQPLDCQTMVRAAQSALCVVLVDDTDQPGGFSSWVLEQLLHAGVTQPVAVVSPRRQSPRQHPHDLHKQCAMQIVERCRWLAEPILGTMTASARGSAGTSAARASQSDWLEPHVQAADDAPDEHRQVLAQQFSPFIDHWVREYSKVGLRDVYLWRWCLHGLDLTTLSSVAPALRQDLCETKLLAVMYGVMLDDVADQGGEEDFLNELSKIIRGVEEIDFGRFSSPQQSYARFTRDLWKTFETRLKLSPCYEEYAELLVYDHQQILNTMSYSCMINRYPALLNVQEHDMYLPHNMQMMSFGTMDLMCSPEFDRRELGKLREVVWHAQSMGRIGNLVSTWQREIADRDFTSGVFARAVCQGDLTLEDLRVAAPPAIEAAIRRGGHELHFLQKWESHRKVIHSMASQLRSVDVGQLLVALQRLIHMELSSRGFK